MKYFGFDYYLIVDFMNPLINDNENTINRSGGRIGRCQIVIFGYIRCVLHCAAMMVLLCFE